ncbi:hypothetical protein PVAND_003254 [Polypedilum vanderplanki]|uniref:Uncharacterized protein n=1 Tax=Polypedilum vanderplanki TaxID=319348 RepID=A0A9J6BUK6_POLVA|nr:hypothetical protein PVAND_003254 [Polypedilum vanderplanki]
MAKVENYIKLFTIVTLFIYCISIVSSQQQLQMLNKSFANLTSIKIKELEEQDNWQIIDLSHNSIEFIVSPELLINQSELETLLLDYNVKFAPKGNGEIFKHKGLKRMSCKGCGFAEIRSQHFAGFDSLTELDLAYNQIRKIDVDAFKENHYLKQLNLSGNHLQVLQVSTFSSLRMFEELDLSNNPIELQKSKHFIKCDSLKSLSLDSCGLKDIYPQTFTELRNLEQLRLNSNQIAVIPVETFRLNEKLRSIFIENNQLKFFPASILDYLKALDELCIDNNPYVNTKEFHNLLTKYEIFRLRSQKCSTDVDTMIEYIFKNDDVTVEMPTQNTTEEKFLQLKFHEGISDFFIGSYLTAILIVQAIAFVLLTLYLIKITKYEKLAGDINYANTILNDNDIYKVFKLNE